jgi:hypothetical protein
MGNTPSSPSEQATSIRSRTSRKARTSVDHLPTRASQAVSFYQTPPGSFEIGQTPTFTPRTHTTDTTSPTTSESPSIDQRTQTEMPHVEASSEPIHPKKWRPGVYSLVNVKSGTVIDLSGADDRSIIGFPSHGGKNQQVLIVLSIQEQTRHADLLSRSGASKRPGMDTPYGVSRRACT